MPIKVVQRAPNLTGRPAADRDAARRLRSTPDRMRAVSKALSFGFADELDAAGAALETGVTNIFQRATGQSPAYSPREAYDAVWAANNTADNVYARENPGENLAIQIVGGALSPGAGAGARFIAGAPSLLGATLRSAGVGAGFGLAAGAGNSGQGFVERAKGGGQGAVMGAIIGGAMPSAGRVAQTTGRAVNAAIGQPFNGASRGAAARLREALQMDGLDEATIRQRVAEWERSGVTPEFLNVVGENTRALLRTAAGKTGPARTTAQQYRDRTVAGIPDQAIERTNALTPGETRTPQAFAESARTAREVAAKRNYAGPYQVPVDVPETVSDMLRDPAGRVIISRARADAIENGDWAMQKELEMLLNGARDGQLPRVSAGTIDRLSIAARERGQTLAARGARNRSRGSMGRRDQLDEVLEQVPEIQPARDQYRRQSQAIEAAEGGPSVLGPTSAFAPSIDNMQGNVFALRGAQVRERQALRDYFGTRDQVSGRLGDIADAPDLRPNLTRLYGDRGARFADAAGNLRQKQGDANFIAPNTGSQTQPREQDAETFLGGIRSAMEVAGGSLRPIIERLARGLTMTEGERAVLLNIGIGTPDDALRALAAPPPATTRALGPVVRRASVGVAPAMASQQTEGY